MVARVEGGKCRIVSRNGKDWTAAFDAIAAAVARLPVESAWIDGEIVIMDARGRTSFQALQNVLSESASAKPVYCVFDLPYLNGYDLREATLGDRTAQLRKIIGEETLLRFRDHAAGNGGAFCAAAGKGGTWGDAP